MKKFVSKVVLLLCIICLLFCSIAAFDYFVVQSQYRYNYQASIIDKINRLESINEPKIILVGHSNLVFGIDSKMLEEATGMPVVNLGLNGALGNAFHEEMAKMNINEGDIVIVCHASYSDTDEIEDTALAWITIDNQSKYLKILRPKDYIPMLSAYPDFIVNSIHHWIKRSGNVDAGGVYSRSSFNEYGDIKLRLKEEQINPDEFFKDTDNNGVIVPTVGDKCVNRLNKYNDYITERGATLLVAGYPIAYGEYSTFTEDDFINFKKELQSRLDCEVISDYTDYFYSYDYFYDTIFHLTEEGAQKRTQQLILDINRWKNTQ